MLQCVHRNERQRVATSGPAWSECPRGAAEVLKQGPAHLTPPQTGWSRSTVLGPLALDLNKDRQKQAALISCSGQLCVLTEAVQDSVTDTSSDSSLTCSPDTRGRRWLPLKHCFVPFSKYGVHHFSIWICNHTLYLIHCRAPCSCLKRKYLYFFKKEGHDTYTLHHTKADIICIIQTTH